MHSLQGERALCYRRLHRADLDVITAVELDPDQIDRFLGPLEDIVAAVRRALSHTVVMFSAQGVPVGFYVVYPSPRDASLWWLGWFAVDRRWQGRGCGVQAMQQVLRHLEAIPSCRRIRLLVATDNLRAQRIYRRAGFRPVDVGVVGNEIVLELALPSVVRPGQLEQANLVVAAARARRVFQHRRLRLVVGPHPAWTIGVVRGPPASVSRRARGAARQTVTGCGSAAGAPALSARRRLHRPKYRQG